MEIRIRQLTDHLWEIPRDNDRGMRVSGRIYASERMMPQIRADDALRQVIHVAHLPGIVGYSLAMPDIHRGYGFPIGGVAATDPADGGVVSPGGVGYDIGCGVRLLATDVDAADVRGRLPALAESLFEAVPCGLGEPARRTATGGELTRVLTEGAAAALALGGEDGGAIDRIEGSGLMEGADPRAIGDRARERGARQLGSLGSGNHFVEIQQVDRIEDPVAAEALGLRIGALTIMVHTGSRGLGHQVCEDNVRALRDAPRRYGYELPDRELACAPVRSPEGERYLAAMRCAANFAYANRQILAGECVRAAGRALGGGPGTLGARLVYDVAHNLARIENHRVGDGRRDLCVHRKGATRALPPGDSRVPAAYRSIGQPVIVPGDMGRYSFMLTGRPAALDKTFGSICHGAGRVLSRAAARREIRFESLMDEMANRGILLLARGRGTAVEEAPRAYKDVADVVDVVARAGLARVAARLRPLAVIKG